MKLTNLFTLCGGVLLSAALLVGCSDSDGYDVVGSKGNLAYFEAPALNTPYQKALYDTPAGLIGGVGQPMKVYFQKPVGKNTTVSVKANPEAAQKFLDDHNLDYPIIPEEFFDYSLASATVESGNSESTDAIFVMIKSDKIEQLLELGNSQLFAAFTIDKVTGDGESSTSRNTYYAVISNIVSQDLHFVNNDKESFAVVYTPVGNFGSVVVDKPFSFDGALNQGATITFTQDNSLVAESGVANAVAVPDGAITVTNATVTVPAGESVSTDNVQISIPESKYDLMESGKTYVAPFRLSVTREDGVTDDEAGVYYMVITTSERIAREVTHAEDVIGTAISSEVMATWSVTASSGSANISNVRAVDNSTWSRNRTYTIDMKQEYNVTGLELVSRYYSYASYGYIITSAQLEVSTDNVNWTNCGSVTSLPVENTMFQYYGLYGAIPARYLRLYIGSGSSYGSLDRLRVLTQ